MTFQSTVERPRVAVGMAVPPATACRRDAPMPDRAAAEMLNYVDQAALIADQLRGLNILFRGCFCAQDDLSVERDAAAAIVSDCLETMARRLDHNAVQARARCDHLKAGGER